MIEHISIANVLYAFLYYYELIIEAILLFHHFCSNHFRTSLQYLREIEIKTAFSKKFIIYAAYRITLV